MKKAEDDDKSRSPSSQQRASSSSPTPSDNPSRSGVVSKSRSTLQGTPSYADIARRRALASSDSQGVTGAKSSATSDQPLQSRGRRPVNNPTTAVPATAPTTRSRTTRDSDTSELDTAPNTRSRDGQPPAVADGPQGEGNTIRPHAPKVDRIPSRKPSTHSAHTPNQPSLPTSPPSHAGSPVITKTASNWTGTARGILPGDPASDAQNGGASSEVSHAPNEIKGSAYPSEQIRSSPSASPHKPPLPSGRAAPTVGLPSQPQSVPGPRSMDRSNSRIQENEGVEREAKRATEGSTLDKTERKRTTTSKEPKSHRENSATDSYNPQRRKPESSPPSSFASHTKRHPNTAPESSPERTYSYGLGHGPGSSTSHLPNDAESRGRAGHSPDSLLSSDTRDVSAKPLPASISATRSLSKDSVGVLSRNNPTDSSVDTNSRPPTAIGNSEIRATPSFSRAMSSHVPAPIAPITSQPSQKKGETHPGPILPSKSVGQPSPAVVPPVPQKGPYAGSLRKASNDTPSRLPDDHHHGEVDLFQGAIENKPQAKLSDGMSLSQPSVRTEPMAVSPDMREARGSQAQPSHSISQQHSQPENRVLPNQLYHADPLMARQIGIPSEPADAVQFMPVITYVPVPVGGSSSPPPYERNPPRVPGATRDEPNKFSASQAPAIPDDSSILKEKTRDETFGESVAFEPQGQMDRSEIKRRLGIDGTAAVHAPDNAQPVVVNYTYERALLSRPAEQTISELTSEFRQGKYLNPSQGNPPDSRTDRSSVTDDEGPTNQSAPGGYHSVDSHLVVTKPKPSKIQRHLTPNEREQARREKEEREREEEPERGRERERARARELERHREQEQERERERVRVQEELERQQEQERERVRVREEQEQERGRERERTEQERQQREREERERRQREEEQEQQRREEQERQRREEQERQRREEQERQRREEQERQERERQEQERREREQREQQEVKSGFWSFIKAHCCCCLS